MTVFPNTDDLRAGTITAYRYLAFLDAERRWLVHELFPDRKHDERVFVPMDSQVDQLTQGKTPLERAEAVLLAAGVQQPTAHDHWVKHIGVDFKQIPIVGSAGEGKQHTKRK